MKITAEKIITVKVPIIDEELKIEDIEKLLIQKIKDFETIDYIYVIDKGKKFKGVLSLKELFRSPKNKKIKEVLPQKELIHGYLHTDQERIGYLALHNNLKAVPILDKEKNLKGVVPYDTILKIIDSEGAENLLRMGGISHTKNIDDINKISILKALKHRLPWLLIGLLGGLFSAQIVEFFESTIAKNLILASFIPLIVYMADSVGTQTEAFVIRDFAINPKLKIAKYFARQILSIIFIGLVTSVLLLGATIGLYGDINVSMALSISLFIAILTSVISGLFIPYTFEKLKMDPANASGPIATIIQDIISVTVYFLVAQSIL